MSRNLYSAIESKTTWDSNIKLSELACEELEFWLKHLGTLPCRVLSPFWRSPERVLFTDASSFAGAGVLLHSQNQVAHCMFNQHDKLQSSTYRELKALQFALVAFSHFLAGKFVKVYSDNQNVVRITSKGSTVKSLQIIAREIFYFCFIKSIILEVAWIPRQFNQLSDFFSKDFDYDDWGVSQKIFDFFFIKNGVRLHATDLLTSLIQS